MNVTGCYIFFKRMTSVCNTNMRPLWCQKNESIGKMKTKKRVLRLLTDRNQVLPSTAIHEAKHTDSQCRHGPD